MIRSNKPVTVVDLCEHILDEGWTDELTVERIRSVKAVVKSIDEEKKKDGGHQCPRCKYHHTIQGNHDNLCDNCCRTILEHFPEHWSVPHIKDAYAKWTK